MILNFSFLEKSDISNSSCFLFYGDNQGRVEDCSLITIKSLKKKFGKISVNYYSNDDLKKGTFNQLLTNSTNEDLFANKNVLVLSLYDQRPAKEIVETLKKNISLSVILIIKCAQLKKSSALRKFFEDSKKYLTIPCYEESETDKKNIVRKFFHSENLDISEEEIELISNILSNQKLEIENELKKLIIYIKTSNSEIRSSISIISENISENINQLIFLLASKNKKAFLTAFFKSKEIQSDQIRLINYLADHFIKLLEVKTEIKSGVDKNFAIKNLRPPIFFKDIPEFNKHVDIWQEKDINFFLRKLFFCQAANLKGLKSCKFQLFFLFLKILNFKN